MRAIFVFFPRGNAVTLRAAAQNRGSSFLVTVYFRRGLSPFVPSYGRISPLLAGEKDASVLHNFRDTTRAVGIIGHRATGTRTPQV